MNHPRTISEQTLKPSSIKRKIKALGIVFSIGLIISWIFTSCKFSPSSNISPPPIEAQKLVTLCFGKNIPQNIRSFVNQKILEEIAQIPVSETQKEDTSGMVWIEGGRFEMGANQTIQANNTDKGLLGNQPRPDEFPKHPTEIDGFWMDKTETTNAQFQKFVAATGWKTIAERPIELEEIMAQLPEGTAPPSEDMLQPASLVFHSPPNKPQANYGFNDWWTISKGANWRHPQGTGSDIGGKEHHPVVHISWYDALAYCRWVGKRLPTEAEWEFASKGNQQVNLYPWGETLLKNNEIQANYWQGNFPIENTIKDGFERLAPVGSFPSNAYGLFDMGGNVWEWCQDWYHAEYYACKIENQLIKNPLGPDVSFDPHMPNSSQKVMRGGSFLCNESYCSGYRVTARMKSSPDTGLEHTGFRCVR